MYHPRINPEPRQRRSTLLGLAFLLLASAGHALPEDASQPIDFESVTADVFLDQGLVIHYGSAEKPARITQGSMVITGLEIRIESENGALKKVTATGTPAHFQQQPAADKEPEHASALTLIYDSANQLLIADKEAELIQAGNTLNSDRIEYDLQGRSARATSDEGTVQMRISPAPAGN